MAIKKEQWNLKNFPTDLKNKIVEIGKSKGYDYANDFIVEILTNYLEAEEFNSTMNFFDQRWQEVIDSNQLLTEAINKNTELLVKQDEIFHNETKEFKKEIYLIAAVQRMYIGYNIEDSEKFKKLYRKFFKLDED